MAELPSLAAQSVVGIHEVAASPPKSPSDRFRRGCVTVTDIDEASNDSVTGADM